MKKVARIKRKFNNFMYDHIYVREGISISWGVFIAALTALLYAFGFYCFIAPYVGAKPVEFNSSSITTGGVGGISQVIWMTTHVLGANIDLYTMQSIFYFALNIPILLFAFFKIGKKFTILSAFNVGLSSLFIFLLKNATIAQDVARLLYENNYQIARVLFAAVSIGLASSLAFRNNISCGGIDVISYYFALRKSTSVGKYATALNSIIIISYALISLVGPDGAQVSTAFLNMLFSFLYLFVVMLVVDFVNIRNKKVQIQIITSIKDISSVLIANFPHSTTMVNGQGGYSHSEKYIVYMVVSSNEVKRVVELVKKVDQHSFVTVTSLVQAYGNFFIKPIE